MEERFLYHIWDECHLTSELSTVSGKAIKIIYQGQYNTGRGPDFKNAIIEIGNEQLRGDVEIHIKTQDWQAHNHHEDVYYNQVVLHVVMEHKAPYSQTILEDGSLVEILELRNQLSQDIIKLLENHDKSQRRSVYCDLLSAIDNDSLMLILHRAGLRRFKSKIARFNSALSLSSFDQIFYEGIFEALGYDKNKLNTMQIAQTLPLAKLKEYKADGMSKQELASIYLCSSGILKKNSAVINESLQKELWSIYEIQAWYGTKINIDWQLFRVRPHNHPLKRILYISELVYNNLDSGLLRYFIEHTSAYLNEPKKHRTAFAHLWKESLIFTDCPLSLGKSVINNIYLNIYLPMLALWMQKTAGESSEVFNLYSQYPGLQTNHITRFMYRYMNPEQSKLAESKAIYQQGLIDIYQRFCNWHYCSECLERFRQN